MKRNLEHLLVIGVSSLVLAGCCTVHHPPQWEYKIGYPAGGGDPKVQEAYVNDLAKDGWMFIQRDSTGLYYFKRAKR